jgi:hypothetical protein
LIPFAELLFKDQTDAARGNIDDASMNALPLCSTPADSLKAAAEPFFRSAFLFRPLGSFFCSSSGCLRNGCLVADTQMTLGY